MKPAILVGIYNTEQRTPEFTPPFASVSKNDSKGELYAKMIAEEIKPFIDQRYRTASDRKNTTIGGGSMGALIALYTAGKIKPFVSERFPLARAADAIRHLASRKAMGKVVVTID